MIALSRVYGLIFYPKDHSNWPTLASFLPSPSHQAHLPNCSARRAKLRSLSDTRDEWHKFRIPKKIDGVSYAPEPFKKKENLGVSKLGFPTQMNHFLGSITNARAPNHLYWHQGRPEMVRSAMQSWQGGTKTSSRRTAGSWDWRIGTCNCSCLTWDLDSQIQIVSSINLSSSAFSKFGIYMKLRESSIFPNIFPSMKLKSSTQTPKPWTVPQPEGVAVAILLRLRFARDCHTSEGTAGHGGIALDKARHQALR